MHFKEPTKWLLLYNSSIKTLQEDNLNNSVTCFYLPLHAQVLRLQMTERSLSHMLNLVRLSGLTVSLHKQPEGTASDEQYVVIFNQTKIFNNSTFLQYFQAPRKHKEAENGTVDAETLTKSKECNGAPLLSECALQEVRDDLQLHLCLSAVLTLPVMLSAPSLIHWIRNLRYSIKTTGVYLFIINPYPIRKLINSMYCVLIKLHVEKQNSRSIYNLLSSQLQFPLQVPLRSPAPCSQRFPFIYLFMTSQLPFESTW